MTSFRSRVLFILLSPLPSPSAAWTRIGYFARYLKDQGINVAIVGAFSAKSINKAGGTECDGMKIYNLVPVIILTNFVAHILNFITSLPVSIFLFSVTRPHIVVISVPSSGNTWAFYLIARLFSCKLITDYRDEWEDYIYYLSKSKVSRTFHYINKRIMTKCYRNSRYVITPTEPLAVGLKRRGVKDENIKVIQNGADTRVFRPKDKASCRRKIGIKTDDVVLVYSGHVGAYYRLDILVHALKQAEKQDANVKLLIAGHGSALQSVLKLVQDAGLQNKVTYIGKLMNKEDLVDALCASDMGIIPYDSNPLWKNALPAKSLEYFACGLPVIATGYLDSLLGKIITENGLGLVARPEDIGSLSQAISRLKADKEFRESAGKRAISLIHQKYDRHKLALRLYSEVMSTCLNPHR